MAKVLFKRIVDSGLIDDYPIVDGSVFVTKDGKMFIDYDDTRAPVGGTPDTAMSDRSTNAVQNNVIKRYVDESIEDAKNTKEVYSTTEVKTNKEWIDGKPIYRKVVSSNNIVGNEVRISHGISDLKRVISTQIYASNDNGTSYNLDNNSPTYSSYLIRIEPSSIVMKISDAFDDNWTVYYILEYTKTTD